MTFQPSMRKKLQATQGTTEEECLDVKDFLTNRILYLYVQGQEGIVDVVHLVKTKTHEKLSESIGNNLDHRVDNDDIVAAAVISRGHDEPVE